MELTALFINCGVLIDVRVSRFFSVVYFFNSDFYWREAVLQNDWLGNNLIFSVNDGVFFINGCTELIFYAVLAGVIILNGVNVTILDYGRISTVLYFGRNYFSRVVELIRP